MPNARKTRLMTLIITSACRIRISNTTTFVTARLYHVILTTAVVQTVCI